MPRRVGCAACAYPLCLSPCGAERYSLFDSQLRLPSCARGARGKAPEHFLRRGRRPRRRSPRCGPPRCSGRCSPATGRRGAPGGSGCGGRPRGPGRRGGPGATGCVPRGSGWRGRGTSMRRRGSSACTPAGCISWAAWSASWLQRTRWGAERASVVRATWVAPTTVGGSRPRCSVTPVTSRCLARARV